MSNQYGVGIIGAGWVSGEYVKAFRDHPQTEIIGVYHPPARDLWRDGSGVRQSG
jgi:predicted dehydrogenase